MPGSVKSACRTSALLRSRPGLPGGWELAADARDLTLAEVWRLLQGDDPVLGLHGPDPQCSVGRSVQRSLLALDDIVAGAVETELGRFTLHDVLNDRNGRALRRKQLVGTSSR